ncbi:uncharacterized protein N7473_011520 [Penicillium subrubescens]|uniref:uncharacterized protein n=1 Tax=Penicillium subrubescens TaxID=1316194 RepID=UPI002545A096|nr:uncharacterized protein N7473_011520 [Penicillium subrubescens]KAJ5880467.1 hypothetical protein N7473_011520 [Penicillium subrubescens]
MALPPEQINIKRRREEEPVETLYIQSATRQTKRRFTDYVFERVTINSKDAANDAIGPPPGNPAAQRLIRSPRSVSNLHIPNRRAAQATNANGVPVVRATSPGAEIREAQRMATSRKEAEEKRRRALQPQNVPQPSPSPGPSTAVEPGRSSSPSVTPLSSRAQSLRRFQISRSNSPSLGTPRTMGGGIQKRRPDGAAPGVAVLVEQLRRQPHSRQASMVAGLVDRARVEQTIEQPEEIPVQPRKRPVVNQAERKWRAERQGAITAAKQHLSEVMENSAQQAHHNTWEEESERLVKDLEQYGLYPQAQPVLAPTPISPPKPMKYQPRPPKQPRSVPRKPTPEAEMEGIFGGAAAAAAATSAVVDDNEEDYVYDVYIRRPLSESEMLTNPLAELECEQQLQQLEAASRGIGVIVITAEDEQYWEHFVEDEEEEWDSEDADSNAENNPANEYPDEELSFSDEEDDPTAIYRKYRHRATSDDEEFDIDDSGSEGGARYGSGYGFSQRYAGDGDSDEDSD